MLSGNYLKIVDEVNLSGRLKIQHNNFERNTFKRLNMVTQTLLYFVDVFWLIFTNEISNFIVYGLMTFQINGTIQDHASNKWYHTRP